MAATLERERAALRRLYPELMPALSGRWIVLHGGGLVAVRPTFDQAAEFAYANFPPDQFLVAELAPEPDILSGRASS